MNMLRSERALISTGDSNRDTILAFLESDGEGIILTDLQEELRTRWQFADDMIRRNVGIRNREDIAYMIMNRFSVSRATAYKDIVSAEYVFSSSSPFNKKYFIQRRMEFLEKEIHMCKLNNDFDNMAKLEKVLQGYVDMYPDDKRNSSPKVIIWNVDARKLESDSIPIQDAEAIITTALENSPDNE